MNVSPSDNGLDEAVAFQLLADLCDALVLTANYNPDIDVAEFIRTAVEFDNASQFLRETANQESA